MCLVDLHMYSFAPRLSQLFNVTSEKLGEPEDKANMCIYLPVRFTINADHA